MSGCSLTALLTSDTWSYASVLWKDTHTRGSAYYKEVYLVDLEVCVGIGKDAKSVLIQPGSPVMIPGHK
ncbi:hypothetical protein Y1Q_0006707 [Alligator mississippiensis]|uniref:Uncharacterized protein n=1 Tax=Alligator mississippiensis TaxID=8496 RepID=A0A151NTA5_ALLMI|nr:hypothetical protein Y1Q_0006707 [Alligator mississippiensis]